MGNNNTEPKQMITQNTINLETPALVLEPFNANDQEGRIRRALGIAWGPLPEVDIKWLHRYHDYLAGHLRLPFDAECAEDIAGYRQLVMPITVVALLPPDHCGNRDELGLHCQAKRGMQIIELPLADVELTHNTPNSRLLDDYWYWFWNWRFDPLVD